VAFNKTQFVNCTKLHTKLSTGDITKSTTFEPNLFFPILYKKMKFMIHAYKCKILCTSAKLANSMFKGVFEQNGLKSAPIESKVNCAKLGPCIVLPTIRSCT
jgi:hypothetical protein